MTHQEYVSEDILYYPSIEFANEAWLKSALCIWERIYRIVPSDYVPDDSDDVKRAVEADIIRNITLTKDDLSECAQRFTDFWDTVEVQPAGLDGFEESQYRLHPDKVDAKLCPLFESLAGKIDPDGFLNLSKEVAHGYMLYLSETVSRRRNIPKLTDRPEVFSVMEYFRQDGRISEYVFDRESEEFSAALTVPNVVPSYIEYAGMNDVLKFRSKAFGARQSFRNAVSTFIDHLSEVEEKSHFQAAWRDFKSDLKESHNSSKVSCADFTNNLLATSVTVGFPMSISAFGAAKAGVDPFESLSLSGIGYISAIAATLVAAIVKSNRENPSNKASYFMELMSAFGPDTGSQLRDYNYARFMEEFIND